MQESMYASMQIYNYAGMEVFKNANTQICEYSSE